MRKPNFVNVPALMQALDLLGLDGLVAVSPKNVFYYSGSPTARILVRNRSWARTVGPVMPAVVVPRASSNVLIVSDADEAATREEAWIEDIHTFRAFSETALDAVVQVIAERGLGRTRLGYEADEISAQEFEYLHRSMPEVEWVAADEQMEWIRSVKTPGELAHMKRSADLTDEAILEGFESARVGDTEWEIHSRIIGGVLARGGEYCRGLFQAGSSNELSFGGTGHKPLEWGDIIHIDYAAYYDGYPANLSRVGVMGQPSPEQEKRYADLLHVEREVMSYMRPGVLGRDVFWFCRRVFKELGYDHTAAIVGHNLGLGYHDRPMITAAEQMPLDEHNVIALEPVLVWAYHIQDQVVVTPSGGVLQSDKFDTSRLFVMGDAR
ncbi:MAG: Xaa-Pro peptidase family protein [bacterium]